jgi:GNAT superfamily N-acetyltransferase
MAAMKTLVVTRSRSVPAFAIKPLTASPQTLDALADILVETVAAGGSVHFMHPLAFADARGFWAKALAAAARGERIVLGAYDDETLVSTVSLLLDTPPNQQHRAEIGKMMTHPRHRGRGAAAALLAEAERLAAANGRTLLNLDTAADDGASGLYEKAGYVLAGSIPDFAFKPHGGLTATRIYWKRIGAAANE